MHPHIERQLNRYNVTDSTPRSVLIEDLEPIRTKEQYDSLGFLILSESEARELDEIENLSSLLQHQTI